MDNKADVVHPIGQLWRVTRVYGSDAEPWLKVKFLGDSKRWSISGNPKRWTHAAASCFSLKASYQLPLQETAQTSLAHDHKDVILYRGDIVRALDGCYPLGTHELSHGPVLSLRPDIDFIVTSIVKDGVVTVRPVHGRTDDKTTRTVSSAWLVRVKPAGNWEGSSLLYNNWFVKADNVSARALMPKHLRVTPKREGWCCGP